MGRPEVSADDNLLKLVDPDAVEAEGYRLQDQIGFILRRAHQRHLALFAQRIPDLTPPQFAALAVLHERGRLSQSELGTATAMDAATIKGVVDRLAARQYVAIEAHGEDRRKVLVGLTQAGREKVEQLIPEAQRITAETLAPLSAREAERLIALLARIA
jgi:DNA-binding MarR family transcriptional regulator